jgi:proteasome lid subunit RPN8/RPN11
MLKLPGDIFWEIAKEGERLYPYECCGLILGTISEDEKERSALKILPINNTREGEDKRRRFVIEPLDFIKAEKEAIALGLSVLGIYHSHPDHPAFPSDYDLAHALPFYSYLIVSVLGAKAGETTSWILKDDRSKFLPEDIIKE